MQQIVSTKSFTLAWKLLRGTANPFVVGKTKKI
jgi:hypothetical protein